MRIGDFIPMFIRQFRLKYRIEKKYGKNNNINTTQIGSNVQIGGSWGGVYLAKGVDIRKDVTIGAYSYCNRGTTIFKGCKIGNYCSIGYNVHIGPPEHPLNFYSTSPNIYRFNNIKDLCSWPMDDILNPVIIGNDVWIGSNAVVLQGCMVGDGAVIAAGSIVTHDVAPYTVVGGVPAKVIKERFSPQIKQLLLESHWWDHEKEWIANFFKELREKNDKKESND